MKIQGARGNATLLRLSQAIEREPARWIEHFDERVRRELGSHVTGMPWSIQEYGRQRIRFGSHVDLERFWTILREFHSLSLQGETTLLGARIRQALKAVERAAQDNGQWDIAWLATGLPDPRPGRKFTHGLSHPAEVAAQAAYVREMASLEQARQRNYQNEQNPWQPGRNKKGDKKGDKGDGRGQAGTPGGGGGDGTGN